MANSVADLEQKLAEARAQLEAKERAEQAEKAAKVHAAKVKADSDSIKEIHRQLDALLAHEAVLPAPSWYISRFARRLLHENASDPEAQGGLLRLDRRFEEVFHLLVQAQIAWKQVDLEVGPEARELEARSWRALRRRLEALAGEIEPDRKR